MSEKSTIAGLISKAAKKLRDDFEYIRQTNVHSGEKGGETEDKVREFLNGHIPKRFHATAGFVIDVDNQMSDHQDVIIYDAQSSPVYRYEGHNQIVSADAVAAVIEVKSVLNKSQLEEAYAKIEDIKKLRKSPIGGMDQKTNESALASTGTLGIILAFSTNTDLEKLAGHCIELNETYETAHRPDLIVVLDVGVINYVVQFVGAHDMGDLAPACDDEFVIPPCYVHLIYRADGVFALNRLFTHLLSHLALYPRRPSIPPFSVLLEGTTSISHPLAVYQFNTERRLVRYEPGPTSRSDGGPVIRVRHKSSKKELATLTFIPWQDGGVIRKKGKIPLAALLALVLRQRPLTVRVEDAELSTVLKLTRPEFEKWPAVIQRQSDMTAEMQVPPPFEIHRVGSEGTSEPFIARVFLGLLDTASHVLSEPEKAKFDERFGPTLTPALELRKSLVDIKNLVSNHRQALAAGSIVRKKGPDPLLSERIDGPLRSHVVRFLEMAASTVENLIATMKFFRIGVDYLSDREERFAKGCERNEQKHPELVEYLRRIRPTVLEIDRQFKAMRFGGWNLPNVRYTLAGEAVEMIEPQIEGTPLSEYIDRIFGTLALAIEDLIMYGFQSNPTGSMALAEIPLPQRDPQNAQRFRWTLRGSEPTWQLRWTGKDFYQS